MNTQQCKSCESEKHLSEFHFRRDNNKHRTVCKVCRNKQEAARRYDISVGDINRLLDEQDNRCAICNTPAHEIEHKAFINNPLVVDHDHKTGKVRGLLCPTCNNGLGHFKDKPELLFAAAAYLSR